MKTCKRLLAAAMVVLMTVTIMPLGLFASATDTYQITSMAQLKEVLEGLRISNDDNSATYHPADGNYVLATDISPLGDWLAVDANKLTAAEQLGMHSPVPAVNEYVIADDAEIADESVTLYTEDEGNYTEVTDRASIDPDNVTYYVYKETSPAVPQGALTDEEIAALTVADKDKLISENNIENVSITPAKVDFTGTFDGNGKTISGMTINQVNSDNNNAQLCAMFSDVMKEGTVKDFTIDSSCRFVIASTPGISLILGSAAATNYGKIQNITSNATIDITSSVPIFFSYVGGIVGLSDKQENGAEITGCAFGGSIIYRVNDDTFVETDGKKLNNIDTAVISIGGIVGESESPVTGTFTGTIDCNFIGGTSTSIFEVCAGKKNPSGNELTTRLENTDKYVSSKDAAVYSDFNVGVTTKGEPNAKGYQLIKNTYNDKDRYYIRQTTACNHDGATEVAGKPATCTDTGIKDHWKCENCDSYFLINPIGNPTAEKASYNKDIVIPKLKIHSKDDVSYEAENPATCTAEGNKERWYCSKCENYFLEDPTEKEVTPVDVKRTVIAKTAHSFDAWQYENETQHKHICSACSVSELANHKYSSWQKYDATQHKKTCSGCGNVIYEDHAFGSWQKHNETQHKATCRVCKEVKYENHSFGDWQYYNKTQHKATCSVCSYAKTENHTYQDTVVPPTTDAKGYTLHKCTGCGYEYKDNYTDQLPSSVDPKSGSGYTKDSTGKYLITTMPAKKDGITVDQLKNSLKNDTHGYTVRDEKGNAVTSGIVKTGYTVEITGLPKTKVTICVRGDVNKDGKVSSADYVKVKNHILGKIDLSKDKAAFYAADADKSNDIKSKDYIQIKKLIMKG